MKKTGYLLYFDQFIAEERIVPSVVFSFDKIYEWFEKRYPHMLRHNIREHVLKKTTNYARRLTQFAKKPSEETHEDLFFSIDPPDFCNFMLYVEGEHGRPHHSDEIAYEKTLQAKIVADPAIIENGLQLVGEYYRTDSGFIDLLYRDYQDNFLVLELKVSCGTYHTAGQLLYYMGWVNNNLAKNEGRKVRGMVIARVIKAELRLALSIVENTGWLQL
jgi:hypothetical protein